MKEKQKPQVGKQPRTQATMIPGSLVLTSGVRIVRQVLLVAQWPGFRRMGVGAGHRKKPACTTPDQLPRHLSQAAGAPSLSLILKKKKKKAISPLQFSPLDQRARVTPCPGAVSHLSHALLSTQRCTDPEQSLPCCEANAKEVANLNSKSFWSLLGVLTSPILIDRGSREATGQSELYLE